MDRQKSRLQHVKILRILRKVHRYSGVTLFIFFFIVSVTGILLGWKKNSSGYILPVSHRGTTSELKDWLPLDSLHRKAIYILKDSISGNLSDRLNRIDVRNRKGMVKFVFKDHLWEIQLDGASGELLQIAKRRSDLIENIHDGSFIDNQFPIFDKGFKLFYTTLMGLTLLTFTITGFWLWFGPKLVKRLGKQRREDHHTISNSK